MIALPIDRMASLASNYITDYYEIDPSINFVILPYNGAFYKNDLVITPVSGDLVLDPLVLGVDFSLAGYDSDKSQTSAYPLYTGIIIKKNMNNRYMIKLTCRYYGGMLAANKPVIKNIIDGLGIANVNFSNIINKPQLFPNVPNQDYATYITKWDSFCELADIAASYITNRISQRNTYNGDNFQLSMANKITDLSTILNNIKTALPSAINAHINNTNYKHVLTPDMIGLSKVANYGFITDRNSSNIGYISPYVLKQLINNPDPLVPLIHTGHSETASQIGLGNIVNLDTLTKYILGTSLYTGTLNQYLTQLSAINFTHDAISSDYDNTFYTITYSYLEDALNIINRNTISINNNVQSISAHFNNGDIIASANAKLLDECIPRIVLYKEQFNNALYASTLSQLADIEYKAYLDESNVYTNGIYPVPKDIGNLELWLSSTLSKMNISTINDINYVTKLNDLSHNANHLTGLFNLYPTLSKSSDNASGKLKITANALVFDKNKYMRLNKPLILPNDYTIIMVVKNNKNTINILAGDNGYLVNADGDKSINITGGYSLNQNSSSPITELIVNVITKDQFVPYSWGASSNGVDYSTYPLGIVDTIAVDNNVPMFNYLGNYGLDTNPHSFELFELMIFSRILSVYEIAAIQNYINYQLSGGLLFNITFPTFPTL